MRKHLVLLLLAVAAFFTSSANPGDTTWVTATNTQFVHYGNFDTTIAFPNASKTYRKIIMTFTLGKYQCPGSPQYCGDWDYTIDNYLMTPSGDTIELGRLISPYANAGAPRTPWTWTQRYYFDVTDFYPILHDSATVRVSYSGYSWGFTGNIKFAFIEGTPDRNVNGIKRLWHGYFGYGGTTNTINTNLPAVSDIPPFNTHSSRLRLIATGHGSDANGCCEFMPHYCKVYLDSIQTDSTTLWRSDCGANELYPQSGTWAYQRSNWCPGALVYPNNYDFNSIYEGAPHTYQVLFDSTYTSNGGGGYACEATLLYYDNLNKNLDVSLDDVVAPTSYEGHFRENPLCGTPTVHVKNTGATTVTSITLQYGIQDSALSSYTWTGSLSSLVETDITLPDLPTLDNMSLNHATGTFTFVSFITSVNGQNDDDSTNNHISSPLVVAPLWPNTFVVNILTNNQGVNGVNSGLSENTWTIYDVNNNVVATRNNMSLSTDYKDTIIIGPTGCYKLVVTDGSCDGLEWWVHAQDGSGISDGTFNVRRITGFNIALNGNFNTTSYAGDFGCGFVQNFSVIGTWPAGVKNITATDAGIEAFPNPAQSQLNVKINGITDVKGTVNLIDALGRVVMTQECNSPALTLNVSGFANGAYTLRFTDANSPDTKLQSRIVIAK